MKTNRRDFIKISGVGLGSAALAGSIFDFASGSVLNQAIPNPLSTSRTPTYCEICFWKCAGWVTKNEEGEIWKIEGHKDDPHCNGRLCPRGTGGVGMYDDPQAYN
jgi:thiosulfate reductase/polysulfide reductase chain A